MIHVCSLEDMTRHVSMLGPERLISLVAPEEQPPTPPEIQAERHLRVSIHDITERTPTRILPDTEHIAELVDFLHNWERKTSLLIHCVAGISRSMAAAMIALNLSETEHEYDNARYMRRTAPHAKPNRRMIELADQMLNHHGRLLGALDAMGPAKPLSTGPLVGFTLPRLTRREASG